MLKNMKTPTTQPLTDYDIQALVDSQLDWEEEKQIRKWIDSDPALQARYRELMEQKKLLCAWWESELIEALENYNPTRLCS